MSKISELSDGGSLVSSDYLIAVRSGGNVKVRMDQINVDQVDLGDNEFIRLGNSQDLTMVHNATNSIINQAGIGDLLIQKAGATKLTINASGIDVTGSVTATGIIEASDGTNGEMQFGLGTALTTGAGTYDSSVRWNGSAGNLLFSQGAVEKMRITSTGIDVTGSVTADGLTVDGDAYISDALPRLILNETDATDLNTAFRNNGGVLKIQTVNDAANSFTSRVDINHSSGDVSFYEDTGTTPKLFWDASAESLGIGTSSPNTLAHLAAGAGSAVLRLENTDAFLSDNEVIGKIEFETQDAGGAGVNAYIQAAGVSTDGAAKLEFGTGASNSPSTRMTIYSNGNVGIGTTTPANLLEISDSTTGDAQYLNIHNVGGGAVNDETSIQFQHGSTRRSSRISSTLTSSTATNLLFSTESSGNVVERMRIDSSGHAIIPAGVTLGTAAGVYNAANTLDDYEEGTWTPAYSPQSSAFTSITYDAAVYGTYVKVGAVVHIQGIIRTDAISGGSGAVYIGGMPFTSDNYGVISIGYTNGFAGDSPAGLYTATSSTDIIIRYRIAANSGLDNLLDVTDLSTGGNSNYIIFSGTYMTTQ